MKPLCRSALWVSSALSLFLAVLAGAPRDAVAAAPTRLGGRVADRGDGSLILVGRDTGGSVGITYKTNLSGSGSAWAPWKSLGGSFASQPVALVNSNGTVIAHVRGNDNRLWYAQETTAGSRSFTWTVIPQGSTPTFIYDPASVRLGDGRIAVFATGADGRVYQSTQVTRGGSWSAYEDLGKPTSKVFDRSPVVAINGNGALSVFSHGSDYGLWMKQQTAAGGSWGAWTYLGGMLNSGYPSDFISVNYDSANRLIALVNDAGSTVHTLRQTSPSSTTWTTWTHLLGGAHGGSRPAAARNDDGRITVFFYGNYGTSLYLKSQTSPGASTWTGPEWTSFTTPVSSSPVTFTDYRGIIHVFALDGAGILHEAVQTAVNAASYSDWTAGSLGVLLNGL